MLDKELLQILACPETQQELDMADEQTLRRLNELIDKDKIVNRSREKVKQKVEAGLVRRDGKYLYPVKDDIPILLIDEGIALKQLTSRP